MGFSDHQIKCLSAKLSEKRVHTRTHEGITLSYIEGWHAVSEANRIFGFDGWNRETLNVECVWEGKQESKAACGYRAHVRVTVCADGKDIVREGIGFGSARSVSPTDAHELAIKASETDAMKRALSTFGNPFGLALYDKEQTGVRRTKAKKEEDWAVFDDAGKAISTRNTPVQFCSEVRKTIESINDYPGLMAFWKQNQDAVVKLRQQHPALRTEKGMHYGEVLSDLYTKRLSAFADKAREENKHRPEVGDSNTGGANARLCKGPKRFRSQEHLKYVASQACLVCGRTPSQAHHLKHAQLRALGKKPGDQWTVPLCVIHHRQLHDHGKEEEWWSSNKINPTKIAEELWARN